MNLQKVSLGTPPTGVGGDDTRTANTRANANVDVLNSQATLTSFATTLTTDTQLSTDYVGKRVNVNAHAGANFVLPSASEAGADALIYIRNIGTNVIEVWPNPTDTNPSVALAQLEAGEAYIFDSYGVAWNIYQRSRGWGNDEIVQGNSTVTGTLVAGGLVSSGNASVAGSMSVGSTLATAAEFQSTYPNSLRSVQGDYGVMLHNDGSSMYMLQTASGEPYGNFNSYRPFAWNLSSGAVNIDGTGLGTNFGGAVTAAGSITGRSLVSTGAGSFSGPLALNGGCTYPNTTVARNSFKAAAAGKALVVLTCSRIDYAANVLTTMVFGAAQYDQVGSWNGSNTFTAPVAAVYRVKAAFAWASSTFAADYADLFIQTTGGVTVGHSRTPMMIASAGPYTTISIERCVLLAAGAIIYIQILGTTGFYISPDGSFNQVSIEQLN